jgi:hypothetical protein
MFGVDSQVTGLTLFGTVAYGTWQQHASCFHPGHIEFSFDLGRSLQLFFLPIPSCGDIEALDRSVRSE